MTNKKNKYLTVFESIVFMMAFILLKSESVQEIFNRISVGNNVYVYNILG